MHIHSKKSKERTSSASQTAIQNTESSPLFLEDNRPHTTIQKKSTASAPIQLVKYIRKRNGQIVQVPDDYQKKSKERWAEAPAPAAVAPAAPAPAPVVAAPAGPTPTDIFLAKSPASFSLSGGKRTTLAGTKWFKVLYGDKDYSLHIHVKDNGGINHTDDKIKNRSGTREYYVNLPSSFNAKVKELNPFKK